MGFNMGIQPHPWVKKNCWEQNSNLRPQTGDRPRKYKNCKIYLLQILVYIYVIVGINTSMQIFLGEQNFDLGP